MFTERFPVLLVSLVMLSLLTVLLLSAGSPASVQASLPPDHAAASSGSPLYRVEANVAQTSICGTISDYHWTVVGSPYVITCNANLSSGTLLIDPGVVVSFEANTKLDISGTLSAEGTQDQPITFTSNRPAPAKGDWAGLFLHSGSTSSILRHVVVEYGKGISVDSSSPLIDNATIRYNASSGVYLYRTASTISHSVIISNTAESGAGIHIRYGTVTVDSNTISWNNANTRGGGIHGYGYSGGATITVTNNTIDHNAVGSYGGGGILFDSANGLIENNTIANNINQGVNVSGASGPRVTIRRNVIGGNSVPNWGGSGIGTDAYATIVGNLIKGNSGGVALAYGYPSGRHGPSSIPVTCNTIVDNTGPVSQSSGVYTTVASPFHQNVIHGNTGYQFMSGTSSNIDATDNYWGQTDPNQIAAGIYDRSDNSGLGIVSFSPFLSTSDPCAPSPIGWGAHTITGRLTDAASQPLTDMTVFAGSGNSATTDGNGNYTLSGLAAGTYTLTPSKSGYTFSPPTRTVTVPPDATGQDFTAMPVTYSISGQVKDDSGHPIASVTISDGAGHTANTDSSGNYAVTGLAAGTYTLTPSKSGYTFSPASRTVTVPPDATGQNFVGTQQEARLRLLYVPLRWEGSQDSFDAEARTQSDIFIDGVPLRDCRDRVSVETLQVASQNFATFSCSASNCGVGSVRTFVSDTLRINPADYDVIVGLGETSPCAPIAGCSNGTDTIWVTEAYDSVTAHELGHIYGLADEYCSSQAGSTDSRCNDGDSQGDGAMTGDVNWLDASQPSDCPADGSTDSGGSACCNFGGNSCSTINYGVCCLGNKNSAGGRSTMSYANAPEPRGFDIHDQAHLNALPALNCDGAATAASLAPEGLPEDAFQTVLDVHLRVYNSDSVEKESIAIYPGRPTSSSVQQGMNGNYSLSIVNDAGSELWTRSFPLYFDYAGPTVLGTDYSGINYAAAAVEFRIPYQCGMKTLMVYHSDALVFSEELPAGCVTPLPLRLLRSGSDRLLTWQHLAADIDHYEVHRSNTAYFSPDESSLLASAAVADDSTLEYLDTNQVGADAELYYVVVPIGVNGWRYPASTRVGVFNFSLTPGTSP